jgi:spermidine synthase
VFVVTGPRYKTFPVLICLAAFCSIIYELILAQMMVFLFGGTVFCYSVTIGLYLFALGCGAFFVGEQPFFAKRKSFVLLEIGLAISGFSGFYLLNWFSRSQFDYPMAIQIFAYGLIFLIGFLSGIELPLLNRQYSQGKSLGYLLFWDYLGSLIGAAFFPLILYPVLGLPLTALITAFLNLHLPFIYQMDLFKPKLKPGLFVLYGLGWFLIYLHHQAIHAHIARLFG